MEIEHAGPQSDTMIVSEIVDVTTAAKVAAVAPPTVQEDVVNVATGEALFELSSYTGGAPLTPVVYGDMELEVTSTNSSHGLIDQETIGKSLNGEEKKMGRPSHPAWQYFTRGEKRNRFHYNAYCKLCHENGSKTVAVRGVSGNMIRHLQECTYCPAEVVTQLKLMCAQKDAASFNKRHQTPNRGVNVLLQKALPLSKKARYTKDQEKLQEVAFQASTTVAAKARPVQDTSASVDFMPSQLPLLTSETNEELSTAIPSFSSLSCDSDISSLDKEKMLAMSRLSSLTKKQESLKLGQAIKLHSSRSEYSSECLIRLLASSTVSTGVPWDWVWTEQSALTFGNLYSKLDLPSAELLSTLGTTSHDKQISKMKGEPVGVTLAVSWWAAKYPRSNFVLLSLVNALGEATSWDLIDMGVGDITPGTLADKIDCNLVDLQKSGIVVINIVADTVLTLAASQIAVSSSNRTNSALPVLPCFSHTLQMLLGVVLTGSDSSMQTLGEVIEIIQFFRSHRVLKVLRRECCDPEAVLHAPSRHNWYSFIEAIDSVRQYEDMIKTISSKVAQASLSSAVSVGESLFRTANTNNRKDSAGNTMDELAECRLPGAVLRSIQNEGFWENIVAISELVLPIKETYMMMSSTSTSSFPLSDILYQFGRMHQHYKNTLSGWEGFSSEMRSVEQARCLLRTIDNMWKLYDQSLVVLGYTFDYRLQRRFLARHLSSLQWLSIGKQAKQYFRDWFSATYAIRKLSRLLKLSNEAGAHFIEDMFAYKERKYPFDSDSMCNFDNPKYFYMLVSDSHPMIHMFGSRLFSIVTSTPFLGDVLSGKCFLPSTPSVMCSQYSLLPLLRTQLFAQTASRLSKGLLQIIHTNKLKHDTANIKDGNLFPHTSETKSDSDEARSPFAYNSNSAGNAIMEEVDDNKSSRSRIWSKKQWEAMANEWNAHWKNEIESSNQLFPSRAPDSTTSDLTLDQIFIEALPSRLPHDREDAVVDV